MQLKKGGETILVEKVYAQGNFISCVYDSIFWVNAPKSVSCHNTKRRRSLQIISEITAFPIKPG